jgi:hypothetical protein
MPEHAPSASELIQAVVEYLAGTVRPALSGYAAFEALIAIRLLQVADLEYELGPSVRASERERLEWLLGREGDLDELNAVLVELIRADPLDSDRRAEVLEHLRISAEDRLRIANPAYLLER